nr:unnamed protein product [Spirometra erinaceieuropaei]
MKTLKMKPVVEGYVKYRDGKKWKRRYCVLCLSPCTPYVLHLYLGKSYDDFAAHRSSGNVNCVQRPTQGSDEIAAASNCTTSATKTGFPLGAGVFGCRSAAGAGGVAASGVSSASSSGGSGASSSAGGGGGGGGYTANPVTELCNKMEEACQNDFAQAVHVARGLNAPAPYDVITGFESGCHQDRESHVLLLVGRATVHAIAHQTMDDMFTWAETLERHVKDSSYHVTLCRVGGDSGCKLGVGLQASLHVQQWRVCLVGEPSAGCKFICQWRLDAIDTMYTMEPPPGTAAVALAGASGTTGCTSGLLASGLAIGPSSVASGGTSDGLSVSGAGGGGSGPSVSTSGSAVLDCRGSVEDLLVLKTNKNAGKVQGNFTFQVDSHRLPQLTKAIEELMLRRFPTLTSPVATTKSPLPTDDNFPATGLTHSASTTSYGMEISFPAPHRAAAAAATSSLSSSLSQGASAENSSPPVMLMMGRSHPNQACSPLSSSFPREGNLMRSEANRYVNISSSNRSYTGIPAQGDGGQPREKRHQFSLFTKSQGMERSDEIVIPQSRLCGLEASTGAVPDENPTGKDHRQLYHHRPQQPQQWQNGKSLNVPVGSTGSDTGSTRSENSASSCSLARQPQQLHQPPPPPSAPQSSHVFPSVKVFAGVITSLTPAPSTVASSASLASHISDAPARIQSGSGGARGTPPYRGTSSSLRTKTTTPFNSPPRPLLATADPYSGSVNSHQQSSQTSPLLRKISTVSMPKMLMTTVVPPTTAATNAPAPTMAPGTTAYYCEHCHLHGALASAAAAKAVSARHQQHYRGQRHFQHKCKKAAHRRPRSADPSLLVTASESSPAPPQSPRGQEQLPSGPSHFHQDVFTVDEDVSVVLSGKGPPPAAKNPSASSDTASLSLSHRIGQIFQSLYSGLAGGGGAGRGGSSSTRPLLDGSTSVGDESPCLRNSASSTCREGAKPPRPLLPSESKWGACPRVSALHNSPSQDPSRLHCCDYPPLSCRLRPHAFAPVDRCQSLRRSRTFDECDLRRRRVRRQHLLDFLVCDSDSSQTAEEEEQGPPPPPPVTSLVPASSDCLFLLVPNLPSAEKSGDDAGGSRWRSRRFLLHQYGSCCSCHCSWQRTPPGVTAPPPPAPSPTHIVDRSERLGCLSSPSAHSNWGSDSHLALADSSPCLQTSKFRVWRVLPHHKSRNAASLTIDSAATAKSGFPTGPALRAEALSSERSPYPSLTRNRPQTSSSTWSVLSLSLSEWAESAPLRFDASVMSTNAGGGGGTAKFFSPHHRRRLSHSCLFDLTTPIDHPSFSPCCCCSPVSASSLSLSSHEGDAYLSGPASKCLPSVSSSETARSRTSFCDVCGSSVVTGAAAAAAPLAQHRKRAVSHSERDYARRQLQATSKPYRSTLTKTPSSGNGGGGAGGGGGGGNSGILHEYANFEVCGRANTLPYNKHGQRGSDRQAHGRRANADFKSHDLPFAVPAVSDRHQQPSGDVCDGFSAFSRTDGANLKSQEVRTATVSASQQFPSVTSLSSSTASHTSSPGSPPIPYCNLPNPLLATSSSSGGGGGGSMSSSNSYFYQQQQAAAERAALSDAVASYANWPMLCGRRGQVSSGRYGTLSGSPPSLAAPLLPMNSLREPSDAALRPTGEPQGLRRSYCGPATVSEAGKSTCVVPDEVRDPKRNYALVDLRPSPASSVLTPTDITINPSCAGSRASNFSAAGPSAIADGHPSRNACEDLVSEPDSSASTLMGFSTTSSSTLLQQRTQQHSAMTDAGDAGATGSMDSKQSQLSAGFSPRSGTYRRRHSHSLSSALPEPPLNYVHVITMPRRSDAGGRQGQEASQRQFPRQERISVDSLPPRCAPRESWGEESSSGSGAETLLSDPTPAVPSHAADAPRTSDVAYAQIDFVRTRALSAVNGNLESLLSSVSEREAAAMAASLGVAGGSGTATKAGRSAFGLKSVSRSKRIINRGSRKKSNICPGDP